MKAIVAAVALALVAAPVVAQQTVNKKFDTVRCGTHSGNTSGFSWTQCDPPEPQIVTRTEVREVKVPVPGPVVIKEVVKEVPPKKVKE